MPDSGFSVYLTLFLVGLLGGGHCVGMCGGIVGALAMQLPGTASGWTLHLGYNAGRIASYATVGALAGAFGSLSLVAGPTLPLRQSLYVVANVMLVAMGLYLMGMTGALAWVERAGQGIWRRLQPLTARFLPVRGLAQALPLGFLWGWLPCGLVYSALVSALATGSALNGALAMLAFGLGTLPNLLLAGYVFVRFRGIAQARAVRTLSGLLVVGFGAVGLWRAATFSSG
ncbi:MAG: sulfite exporter TauE/SafE family protein [Gammaproteobacteria bacterium]|nr:sulfite exporter TauE/SafE family protein [Gammaproteobacteria bacterium]MBU1647160.1 sulfite exporter TauE/SafE family protein [Gammaproteobacteria bacterium]MBU1972672.1 sulfite exporter TauE/SafE family protein [Gammaproteobacteria bacterium]